MGAADGELPPHPRGFVVASGRAPMDYEAVSRWVEHQASVSSVLPLMQSVAPHPPSQRRRRKKKKRSASAAGRGEGPKLDWDARHPVLFSSSNPNAVPVSSSSSSAAVSHWFAQQLMREEQKWEQRQEELCARIARGVIGHHGQDEGRYHYGAQAGTAISPSSRMRRGMVSASPYLKPQSSSYGVKSPNVARTHVQHRAATAIDHELAHDHSEDVVADAEVAGIMGVAPTSCEHCLPGSECVCGVGAVPLLIDLPNVAHFQQQQQQQQHQQHRRAHSLPPGSKSGTEREGFGRTLSRENSTVAMQQTNSNGRNNNNNNNGSEEVQAKARAHADKVLRKFEKHLRERARVALRHKVYVMQQELEWLKVAPQRLRQSMAMHEAALDYLQGEASEHERVGADMKNGGYVSHRSFGGKSSIGGFHGASDTY